jgi:hypothetical protein
MEQNERAEWYPGEWADLELERGTDAEEEWSDRDWSEEERAAYRT